MVKEADFKNKRALVTGAGSGLGNALLQALVKLGTKVVAVTLTKAEAETLTKEHGASVTPVVVDLSNWDDTREKLEAHCADLDFLCNVAGVTHVGKIEDIPKEAVDSILSVNVRATLQITAMVAKHMKERARGSIVSISSICSMLAHDGHTAYCASKAAVDMITKTAAFELGPHNIRVNAVNPTVVWTEMGKKVWGDPEKQRELLAKIPLRRLVEVHEVIEPILFLLGSESSMISGVCLPIDGGMQVC